MKKYNTHFCFHNQFMLKQIIKNNVNFYSFEKKFIEKLNYHVSYLPRLLGVFSRTEGPPYGRKKRENLFF